MGLLAPLEPMTSLQLHRLKDVLDWKHVVYHHDLSDDEIITYRQYIPIEWIRDQGRLSSRLAQAYAVDDGACPKTKRQRLS